MSRKRVFLEVYDRQSLKDGQCSRRVAANQQLHTGSHLTAGMLSASIYPLLAALEALVLSCGCGRLVRPQTLLKIHGNM